MQKFLFFLNLIFKYGQIWDKVGVKTTNEDEHLQLDGCHRLHRISNLIVGESAN